MAVVPGRLLDHVQDDKPQGWVVPTVMNWPHRTVVKVVFGDDGVRDGGLLGVAGQRLAQRNLGTKRQLAVRFVLGPWCSIWSPAKRVLEPPVLNPPQVIDETADTRQR